MRRDLPFFRKKRLSPLPIPSFSFRSEVFSRFRPIVSLQRFHRFACVSLCVAQRRRSFSSLSLVCCTTVPISFLLILFLVPLFLTNYFYSPFFSGSGRRIFHIHTKTTAIPIKNASPTFPRKAILREKFRRIFGGLFYLFFRRKTRFRVFGRSISFCPSFMRISRTVVFCADFFRFFIVIVVFRNFADFLQKITLFLFCCLLRLCVCPVPKKYTIRRTLYPFFFTILSRRNVEIAKQEYFAP